MCHNGRKQQDRPVFRMRDVTLYEKRSMYNVFFPPSFSSSFPPLSLPSPPALLLSVIYQTGKCRSSGCTENELESEDLATNPQGQPEYNSSLLVSLPLISKRGIGFTKSLPYEPENKILNNILFKDIKILR